MQCYGRFFYHCRIFIVYIRIVVEIRIRMHPISDINSRWTHIKQCIITFPSIFAINSFGLNWNSTLLKINWNKLLQVWIMNSWYGSTTRSYRALYICKQCKRPFKTTNPQVYMMIPCIYCGEACNYPVEEVSDMSFYPLYYFHEHWVFAHSFQTPIRSSTRIIHKGIKEELKADLEKWNKE